MDVIVALDACVDVVLRGNVAPRFHQVEQLIDDYDVLLGGSAAIFACQCAKLQLHTAAVGVVGQDAFGALVRGELAGAGVDVSLLCADPAVKTGVTFALVQEDDRAMLTYLGGIAALTPELFPPSALRGARHLHIASYFLMPQMKDAFLRLAAQARRQGMSVSLDTNWDPEERWEGVRELLGYCDVFLPNEAELAAITGQTDVERALRRAAEWTPHVALKCGQSGARYLGAAGEARADAFRVPCVDAIGAGDSFDAGFVWGFLRGRPPAECLAAGCAAGGLSVRGPGGTGAQGTILDIAALCGFPPGGR